MRTIFILIGVVLSALLFNNQIAAQGTHFFRIAGPAASKIIAFRPDGTLVWSNAQPAALYTIQTTTSLANWTNYDQISTDQNVCTNLIVAFNPPAGMALIPGGTFTMGDTLDGETDAVPTSVTVSGFYMDVNLVSSNQWQSVYNYATNNGFGFVDPGSSKAANHPVQMVDWYDAVKWCNARSKQSSLTPVYYIDAAMTKVYTNGETNVVFANWAANGFRLPTEAEWEKAARGGLTGHRFPWGDTISESQANYDGATNFFSYDLGPIGYNPTGKNGGIPYTTPIGSFAANGYGLYDMVGNVQEWCWDWYYPAYAGGTDPHGPDSSPQGARVIRGGPWILYASLCRCANRSYVVPSNVDNSTGFRCVKGVE